MKKTNIFIILGLLLCACTNTSIEPKNNQIFDVNNVYASEVQRYRQNITLKTKGETFVTYEYKDVRIDEISQLAIKYCEDNVSGTSAHLREIVLYRNNARRATFDCINLAM